MMKSKNFIKRIGAAIMASVCMISSGSTIISTSTSVAADNPVYLTEMEGFPSTDTVIAKAAELLGKPYLLGGKGGNPYASPYSIYSASNVTGIDCSGLIWWTMTSLGYTTHGFANGGEGENPVPIDTVHWLTHNSTPTITYGDKTCNVTFEKPITSATEPVNWWTTGDGKTISPGSVVIADAPEDHSWIYIGEFDNRDSVVEYLKNIGVNPSLLTSENVRDWGTGSNHWRIESYGGGGVRVDNGIDAKGATTYRIQSVPISRGDKGTLNIEKYIDKAGKTPEQIASEANYTDYSKITFTLKNSKGKYITATGNNGLYTATGTGDNAFTFSLSNSGKLSVKNLDAGDYTLTETTNFDGLGLRTVGSQTVKVVANGNTAATPYRVVNHEKEGSLKVVKNSSNTLGEKDAVLNPDVLSNARFTIYDNTSKAYVNAEGKAGSYTFTGTGTSPTTFSLGSNGEFTVNQLPVNHDFSIKETETSILYEVSGDSESAVIKTDNGTAEVSFMNKRKSADVTIEKWAKDLDGNSYIASLDELGEHAVELNEAVRFIVKDYDGHYVTATGEDGSYTWSGTTDDMEQATKFELADDGTFKISNLPTTPGEDKPYTLIETETAPGYTLAENKYFTVESNASVGVDNNQTETALEIDKHFILADFEGEPTDEMYAKCTFVVTNSKGEYLLLESLNAETGEYKYARVVDNELDATVISLGTASHVATINNLPMDTYTVKEYVDSTIFSADSETKDAATTEDGVVKVDFNNTELAGGFNIYKKTASMRNVSGIQFRIYGESYGGRYIDTRTEPTDASGVVSIEGIPYGEYTIEECGDTVLDCFSVADGQTIVIDQPAEAYQPDLAFMNEFYSGNINIKKETESGKSLAGFEFTIYAEEDIYEGALVEENLLYSKGEAIEVLTTDENGEASSYSILPFGYKYMVKETAAVAPYNCDAAPQTFILLETDTHDSEYMLIFNDESNDSDDEENVDDEAETPEESTDDVDDEENDDSTHTSDEPLTVLTFVDTQQKANLTIYKIDEKNERVTLGGAEFDVIALEDIVVDKEIAFNEGDVITHVITDEEGKAEVELWAGTKVGLKETKAPDGYTLTQDITEVDLAYNVDLLYTENEVSVKNAHQMGHLTIYKVDASDNRVTLGGAEFDIVAKTDITVSGDTYKAGDVIAHVVTNSEGKVYYELWSGYEYILRETKAPNGYQISNSETVVSVDYNPDLLYTETSVSIANQKIEIPKQPSTPKTGTALPIAPVAGAGIIALAAIVGAVALRKKED